MMDQIELKERILSIIKEKGDKTFHDLKQELKIKGLEDSRNLNYLLSSLITENRLYYNYKYEKYFVKNEEYLIGIFSETRHSYSFIEIEKENEEKVSYFCPQKLSSNALQGDTVRFKVINSTNKNGEPTQYAKVLRILKRNGNNIIGTLEFDKQTNKLILKTMELFQKHQYEVINPYNLKEGNFVNSKFTDYKNGIIFVKVEEVISQKFEANIDHLYVLKKFQKSLDFPDEIKNIDLNAFVKYTEDRQRNVKRVNLSDELIYTIDGETSKDLDDAVSAKEEESYYSLKVHISDVSFYVEENSELDLEALDRANSIYLIDYVRPMLPKILSDDLCSLNPNTKKHTMTVEMHINKVTGEVINQKIYRSEIISKYRLIYSDVDLFYEGDENVYQDVKLKDSLRLINKIAKILRERKIKMGMIDFVLPEVKVKIDENKLPIEIYNKYQTNSEKVIEDLMVAANETVANFLIKNKAHALFRVHEKPSLEKLEDLRTFAKTIYTPEMFESKLQYEKILNFTIKTSNNITSFDLAKYIDAVGNLENGTFFKVNLIQTMEKARYDIINRGHYALGLDFYLHFTSPIRRYPDLVVHRVLNRILENNKFSQNDTELNHLKKIAEHCSIIEKESMQIERSLNDIKKARFLEMNKSDDQIFLGKIVNILSFGFFVDIDNQIQGLVRYATMDDDEYELDETKLRVIGKNTKKTFKIFDKVNIKISDINISQGTIDMEVVKNEINSIK